MSNPSRKRNIVTVGRISTIKPRPFGDEAGNLQYPIIKHTAMISEGSSGSALLNENLEIVGINLAVERTYYESSSMEWRCCDRIRDFLDECTY